MGYLLQPLVFPFSMEAQAKNQPSKTSIIKDIEAAKKAIERSSLDDSQKQAAHEHLKKASNSEADIVTINERIAVLRAEMTDQPGKMAQ